MRYLVFSVNLPLYKDPPENGEKPKFSQLYVYGRQNELGNRIDTQATKEKLDCSTMKVLQEDLHSINFYVQQYQQAADILMAEPSKELRLIFKAKGSKNVKKQYSLPDVGDVGILAPGDLTEPRDIVLYPSKSAHPSGRATVRINQYHLCTIPRHMYCFSHMVMRDIVCQHL